MPSQKRISVYIEEKDHNKMKAELSLKGLTISEWLRLQIAKFLRNFDNEN